MKASAKDGEGAGRGPCGLRNSELGPRPHDVLFKNYRYKRTNFRRQAKNFYLKNHATKLYSWGI